VTSSFSVIIDQVCLSLMLLGSCADTVAERPTAAERTRTTGQQQPVVAIR
jgi:hypothetical protein